MLLLALSDAHIPERAVDLPHKFKKLIGVPNKIQQVVLLGNCTKSYSFMKFVNQISSNVVVVRGEFDNKTIASTRNAKEEIPLNTIIKQGNFSIGCCNGYTIVPKSDPLSLLTFARQLDVDIVLWGGTHNVEAYTLEGKFFINPGTCTGAFSTDWPVQESETSGTDQEATETAAADAKTSQPTENLAADADETDDEEDKSAPSFCLLDIQGSTCTLYIYAYVDGEVKVDKVIYNKS
ncbi:LANO_0H11430g1_1 [Lachancea nothofagi CBS 11611]|uniref:Vacuolar protein sorting-associated protein 29 n=1 Tax=Lachancea nothofagi CBS 11611 TaxID=1266666 RepID=A0A1G4KM73_9SACH|nr:LANO_0H11430g1_1 [Lachancea nothofagi CBS 11611]